MHAGFFARGTFRDFELRNSKQWSFSDWNELRNLRRRLRILHYYRNRFPW